MTRPHSGFLCALAPQAARILVAAGLVAVAVGVVLNSPEPGYPCGRPGPTPGALRVAVSNATGAAWYDAANPPPALTDQITQIATRLYPGATATMVAYVKNAGSARGTTSISVRDLVDSGGAWTDPERRIEPVTDIGDLSANIDVTVLYSSSLAPQVAYTVARGSLRALAGRVLQAPVVLSPYTTRSREVGTWRIAVAVPASADNRIQGDTSSCSVRFGLTQCPR
ncbi:MAG TPA: hypothetical protein VF902_04875 [Coriobacteriia bacterium]